jgi:hypothetical protein
MGQFENTCAASAVNRLSTNPKELPLWFVAAEQYHTAFKIGVAQKGREIKVPGRIFGVRYSA